MTDERLRTGGAFDALPSHAESLVAKLRGRILSGYEVREIIGSGGMGYVLHATRAEGDFDRVAAVKVVPATLGSSEIAQRFRTEVQILAKLNHPSIAQLYDAGETEEGWPYLIMEYVDGSPIDAYCSTNNLSIDTRVQLLIDVARAVRFAHARLIVHRDLKPSNVLVDQNGRPKLLDFGIAKLLEPGTPEHTVGHRPMTPQYASPEQLLGGDITIGSDIYQLGILSLLVIAEETPLESLTLQDAIRNAAAGHDAAVSERAASRLPTDLLAVVTRCLHSDPDDRYSDVNALLGDLTRYQQGYPVEARKGSRIYRLRKLVQRNVPATAFAFLAALIAVGGTATYAINITEAQRLAEQRAETSNRVLEALASLVTDTFEGFIDHNAEQQVGTAAVVESVLQDTVNVLRDELTDEPGARSNLLRVQGSIEKTLGNYPAAASSFDEAAELLNPSNDPESYAQVLLARADVALQLEDLDTGRALVDKVTSTINTSEATSEIYIELHHLEGTLALYENRYDDALTALGKAITGALAQPDPDNRVLASLYATQMNVHMQRNEYDNVLVAAGKALELLEQTESRFSSKRVAPLRLSARAHVLLGDLTAAREALQQAMSIASANFGDVHPLLADVHHTYGLLWYYAKDLPRAVQHVEKEIQIIEELYGPSHPSLTRLAGNLGLLYTDIGEMEKAGEMLRRQRDALDPEAPEHRHTLYTRSSNEARRLRAIGDYPAAIELGKQCREIAVDLFGPDSIEVANAEDEIALSLHSLGRYAEAREWFTAGVNKYRDHYGKDSDEYKNKLLYYWRYDLVDGDLVAARDKLHELMMEDVENDEVDAIWPVHMFTDLAHINLQIGDMARAEQALTWAKTGAATAPRHPWALYTDLVEAEIRLATGEFERARQYAEKALTGMRGRFPMHTARMRRAQAVLDAVAQ